MDEKKKALYEKGLTVFILLIALSIGEFLLGYYAGAWWAPILVVATIKAFFVVRDYMHIGL
jgi:Prokaryotic Cytochrome C oxidase subunit IV